MPVSAFAAGKNAIMHRKRRRLGIDRKYQYTLEKVFELWHKQKKHSSPSAFLVVPLHRFVYGAVYEAVEGI